MKLTALVVSVGLLLADRQVDLGLQLEKVPSLIATVREHFFPAPKPIVVRSQEKHFEKFCACDVY